MDSTVTGANTGWSTGAARPRTGASAVSRSTSIARANRGTQHSSPLQRSRRLLSYVGVQESDDADDREGLAPEVVERKKRVAKAGVLKAMKYEGFNGRHPLEMQPNNPGYDIKSLNEENKLERYIEVKAVSGLWNEVGVILTKEEYEYAIEMGDKYWLYVVERAEEEDSRLYRIQNPAAQITHYGFDHGWKHVSQKDE